MMVVLRRVDPRTGLFLRYDVVIVDYPSGALVSVIPFYGRETRAHLNAYWVVASSASFRLEEVS